jgi:HNH/ENDO VII superfamily nuclease/SMI1/KNR4 family protein SUKH-1
MTAPLRPGAQYALRLVNLGSRVVRERFDRGVLVAPDGFPDWEFHARAMVALPDPPPDLTVDEIRVVDVLAANALMREAGTDPLWWDAAETPHGWTWAHTGGARRLALVPIELHASFRHAGGISVLAAERAAAWDAAGRNAGGSDADGKAAAGRGAAGRPDRGLRADFEPRWPGMDFAGSLRPELLVQLARVLGCPLPPSYLHFMTQTDGAFPVRPGVLAGHGFVFDQGFFGLARADPAQHLLTANEYVGDRFTRDFLAIAYVQGGMLAVRLTGPDADSIWYWDDDDPRATAADDATIVADRLLHRVADTMDNFWRALAEPAQALRDRAATWVAEGQVVALHPGGLGESLPPSHRAPGWPPRAPDGDYFGDPAVQLALLRETQDEPATRSRAAEPEVTA